MRLVKARRATAAGILQSGAGRRLVIHEPPIVQQVHTQSKPVLLSPPRYGARLRSVPRPRAPASNGLCREQGRPGPLGPVPSRCGRCGRYAAQPQLPWPPCRLPWHVHRVRKRRVVAPGVRRTGRCYCRCRQPPSPTVPAADCPALAPCTGALGSLVHWLDTPGSNVDAVDPAKGRGSLLHAAAAADQAECVKVCRHNRRCWHRAPTAAWAISRVIVCTKCSAMLPLEHAASTPPCGCCRCGSGLAPAVHRPEQASGSLRGWHRVQLPCTHRCNRFALLPTCLLAAASEERSGCGPHDRRAGHSPACSGGRRRGQCRHAAACQVSTRLVVQGGVGLCSGACAAAAVLASARALAAAAWVLASVAAGRGRPSSQLL